MARNKSRMRCVELSQEYDETEVISGIYAIECSLGKKIYIGESNNIYKRWNEHITDLKKKRHHNQNLQYDYNILGFEHFEFKILQPVNADDIEPEYKQYMNYIYENIYMNMYKSEYELYNIENTLYSKLLTNKYEQRLIKQGYDEKQADNICTNFRKGIVHILAHYYFEYDGQIINHYRMLRYDSAINGKIKEADYYKQNILQSQIVNYFTKVMIPSFLLTKTISYLKDGEIYTFDVKYVRRDNKEKLLSFLSNNIHNLVCANNENMGISCSPFDVNLEDEIICTKQLKGDKYKELKSIPLFNVFSKIKDDNKDMIPENYTYTDFREFLLNNNILNNDNGRYAPNEILTNQNYVTNVGPSGGIYLTQEGGAFLEQFFKDTYNNKKEVQNIGKE